MQTNNVMMDFNIFNDVDLRLVLVVWTALLVHSPDKNLQNNGRYSGGKKSLFLSV